MNKTNTYLNVNLIVELIVCYKLTATKKLVAKDNDSCVIGKDGIHYFKPHLRLEFPNGYGSTYYFDDPKELKKVDKYIRKQKGFFSTKIFKNNGGK